MSTPKNQARGNRKQVNQQAIEGQDQLTEVEGVELQPEGVELQQEGVVEGKQEPQPEPEPEPQQARNYWNPISGGQGPQVIYEDEVFSNDPNVREAALHGRIRNQEIRMAAIGHAMQSQAKVYAAERLDLEGRISNIENKVGVTMEQQVQDNAVEQPVAEKMSLLAKAKAKPLATTGIIVAGAAAVVGTVIVAKKVYDHYHQDASVQALEAMPEAAPVEQVSDTPEAMHY